MCISAVYLASDSAELASLGVEIGAIAGHQRMDKRWKLCLRASLIVIVRIVRGGSNEDGSTCELLRSCGDGVVEGRGFEVRVALR